jgi:hypothetical protein
MALSTVTYACNHVVHQKIYGTKRRRIWFQAELEKGPCPKCRPSATKPAMMIYFRPEKNAVDVFLINCKFLREQIYYSRRRYRFITEKETAHLPIKLAGWYKQIKPAERFFSEVNFARDIGIWDIAWCNEPPEEVKRIIQLAANAMKMSTMLTWPPSVGKSN